MVPNHMGVASNDNAWWNDVLENGPASPYAAYFDINWEPLRPDLNGKVLLPVLGDQYGAILEKGEIELRFDAGQGSFSAWYYDNRDDTRDFQNNGFFPGDFAAHPPSAWMGFHHYRGQ